MSRNSPSKHSRNYTAKRANKAPSSLTPEKKADFLNHLRNGISLAGAARAVGVSHETVYARKRDHAEFAKEIEVAREAGADRMEDALLSQGVSGKNATALIFLLKGARPHKYRENVALTGGDGGPVQFTQIKRTIVRPRNPDR